MQTRLKNAANFAVNAALVVALVAVTLAFRKGVVSTPKRGFFCADPSIRYNVVPEAISTNVLLASGTFAAFVLILVLEAAAVEAAKTGDEKKNRRLLRWLIASAKNFAAYLLGLCSTALIVEVGKCSTGVLRPNFMAVCRPNITCQDDPFAYHVDDFYCAGLVDSDPDEEEDLRKSFPSGHAAVVSFMAAFMCLRLRRRAELFRRHFFLAKPFLQIALIAFAWFASLTRVADNVHHVSDVVVGVVLGVSVAVWSEFTAHEAQTDGKKARKPECRSEQDMEMSSTKVKEATQE